MKRLILTSCLCTSVAFALPNMGSNRAKRIINLTNTNQSLSTTFSTEAKQRVWETIVENRIAKGAIPADQRKISSLLTADASGLSNNPLLERSEDGQLRVKVKVEDLMEETKLTLESMGLTINDEDPSKQTVVGTVDQDTIDRLATLEKVEFIEPIIGSIVRDAGMPTKTEGHAIHKTDLVQEILKISGANTSVCVISDGIEGIDELTQLGELPTTNTGTPAVEVCPLNENIGSEGLAMLEIVHDMAPGANLAFCPAFGQDGELSLADSILWLAQQAFSGQGCDIIVDDVGYLTEPYFQDGIVAQVVDYVEEFHDVTYVSAAGNDAESHYEHPYVDIQPGNNTYPGDLHNFGGFGDVTVEWAGVVAGGGNFFAAFLQWDEAFGTAGTDFDVYIFDENGYAAGDSRGDFPIGAAGVDFQDGDDNPLEVAYVVNEHGTIDEETPFGTIKPLYIVIDRYRGNPAHLLEMNFNGFFAMSPDFNIPKGSIWGHAAAHGALATAATGATINIDGVINEEQYVIEPFSSQGPSLVFFDVFGRPKPDLRMKPNLTAVDGVSVSGVNFPTEFYGTSAAAPHAAAVAALVKEVDGTLTPAQIRELLQNTSTDRPPSGFNTIWGYGLLDGLKATKKAGSSPYPGWFYVCSNEPWWPYSILIPERYIKVFTDYGFTFGPCQ